MLATGGFSALAGGVALAMLMLPTVMLTAEEAMRMVPQRMREAAFGMGARRPGGLEGRAADGDARILTGVMLAVARAAGETAPLLFTALFSDYWLSASLRGADRLAGGADLQLLRHPFENQIELAWAASLVLVLIVLVVNVLGQPDRPRRV